MSTKFQCRLCVDKLREGQAIKPGELLVQLAGLPYYNDDAWVQHALYEHDALEILSFVRQVVGH